MKRRQRASDHEVVTQLLKEATERERLDYGQATRKTKILDEAPNIDLESPQSERLSNTDLKTMDWLDPQPDKTITEIIQEVQAMRLAGKLKPFVEGEPIGVIPRRVRINPMTDAQVEEYHNRQREEERDEMLRLRARNNATMASIMGAR